MSIYQHLSTPLPPIVYTILHQASPSVPPEEYTGTMKELHAKIAAETAEVNAGYKKSMGEMISREAQTLKGALSQFLQTPIRSDNDEVQRIVLDALERFRELVAGPMQVGVLGSSEGLITAPMFAKPADRKLARNGKQYLAKLGFSQGKGGGPVYESDFHLLGSVNLDVIEHFVRDRFGIYSSTHGKHLAQAGAQMFAAYNVVSRTGNGGTGTGVEAVIWFDKPAMHYAEFREGLSAVLDALSGDLSLSPITVRQRKLGLGKGMEFSVRFPARSTAQIEEALAWLRERKKPEFVCNTLSNEGALMTREIVV